MTNATYMTLKQTAAAFGVTLNTLNTWINGTPRKQPLPIKRKGRAVLVPISRAQKWAEVHAVPWVRDVASVLMDPTLAPVKPGPRAGYKVAVEV